MFVDDNIIHLSNLMGSLKRHLSTMSYFNASESKWHEETSRREGCHLRIFKHLRVLKNLYGWDKGDLQAIFEERQYLVDTQVYLRKFEEF